MPIPGIYCINSTGEAVSLLTEGNNDDEQLLRELLDEHEFKQYPDLWDVLDSWEEQHETYTEHDWTTEAVELRRCYNDIAMVIDYDGRD